MTAILAILTILGLLQTAVDALGKYGEPEVVAWPVPEYVVQETLIPGPQVKNEATNFTSPPAEATAGPFLLSFFEPDEAEVMARVRWCESRGQADAQNPSSSAAGDFQVIRSTWEAARAGLSRLGMQVDAFEDGRYDRKQNTLVAWWLLEHGGGLSHWNASRECWR